jgi:hypothetical protein
MITAIFKLGFLLSMMFATVVGAVRVRPSDDSNLRTFFTSSEECPMPCFIGIRPGITRIDEARRILRQHQWRQESLDYLDVADYSELDSGEMFFSQPDGTQRIKLQVRNNTIRVITNMQTEFRIGDIWLLLGAPESAYGFIDEKGRLIQNLVYFDGTVLVGFVLPTCSVKLFDLARATTQVTWMNTEFESASSPTLPGLRGCVR